MLTKEKKQKYFSMTMLPPHISILVKRFSADVKLLLQDNILSEYLFGSYAVQTQTPCSDIDILIVVKNQSRDLQWKLAGLASDYSLAHDICFSPILQDQQSWDRHKTYKTLFYREVTEKGVLL